MVRVAAGMLAALLACGGELFLPGGDGAVLVSAAEKVTGDDIDQLRSKLSGLSAKADEYTSLLQAAKNDQARKIERMKDYESLITTYNSYIATSQSLAEEYSKQIQTKTDEIAKKQEEYDRKYAYFLERLRATKEEGKVSYLQLIFSAGSFLEMLESLERSGDLLNYDKEIMEQLESETASLEAENAALVALRTEEKKNIEEYEVKAKALQTSISEMEAELEELKENIDSYEGALEYLEKEEEEADAELDAMLSKYYAQQKAEEEARKRQEEQDRLTGTTTTPTKPPVANHSSDGTIWPLPSAYTMITSPFGYRTHPLSKKWKMHTGTDIYAPRGTSIYAVLSGTVITAGYSSSYGNYVVIDHGGGVSTLYAHASSLAVSSGQTVSQGDTIAYVGMTGSASGYHLHIEWRVNGEATNAMNHISP